MSIHSVVLLCTLSLVLSSLSFVLLNMTETQLQGTALTQKSHLARVGSILVRVISWIVLGFYGQKERSTKSHELNTKLVTTEVDF